MCQIISIITLQLPSGFAQWEKCCTAKYMRKLCLCCIWMEAITRHKCNKTTNHHVNTLVFCYYLLHSAPVRLFIDEIMTSSADNYWNKSCRVSSFSDGWFTTILVIIRLQNYYRFQTNVLFGEVRVKKSMVFL